MVITDEYLPTNIDGISGRCNNLLHNCKHPLCDYHYGNNTEVMICPECDTPRERCSQYPTRGRNKCRYHGGHTQVGMAASNHSGKGLSTSVPTRMLDQFVMHYKDPDILNMTDDIALLKMRRDALLEKIDENPVTPQQWKTLAEKFEALTRSIELGHENKVREALWNLGKIITAGYSETLLWEEVNDTVERTRKVRDSEIRRRKIAQTVITEQQFNRIIGFIIHVIQTRVSDKVILTEIMRDLESLNV